MLLASERSASATMPPLGGGAVVDGISQVHGTDAIHELVRRAQARDEGAFSALYEHFSPKIHSYLYYHLNGHSSYEAEDLTNEVFIKVLEKIHTFEFRGLPFSAWLYRIAHNRLIDHVRGQPKAPSASIDDCLNLHQESAQRALENALDAEDLRAALVDLTEEQRQVIVLRFVQGLNTAETAAAMDKSEDAVKKLQARGLITLKKILLQGRTNGRH